MDSTVTSFGYLTPERPPGSGVGNLLSDFGVLQTIYLSVLVDS